jgi:hypothetical protein
MKKIAICSVVIIVIACAFGFRKTELNADDYVHYVESDNNALSNSKEIEGLKFQLQYCPTEYLLLKELKTDLIPQKVIDERKQQNDSMVFFRLRISAKGKNDVLMYGLNSDGDYYSRIQYLSYGLEEDIALLNNNDTIFPAEFHFERTYGVAPFADFIMAFNTKIKKNDDFQVLIDDKAFGNGVLKFSYSNKDLQNIPTLKLN